MSTAYNSPSGYQASPGYPPQPSYSGQPGTAPGYGTQQPPVNVTVTHPQQVVITGNCPSCRMGVVTESFTVLGILLAIIFFPIGILCCLLMAEKKCDRCGATF